MFCMPNVLQHDLTKVCLKKFVNITLKKFGVNIFSKEEKKVPRLFLVFPFHLAAMT